MFPSSASESKPSKQPARRRQKAELWLVLTGCLAYASSLKMEAVRSSETSVNYQITWYHILEYSTFPNFRE
jgi:hypothetical protein